MCHRCSPPSPLLKGKRKIITKSRFLVFELRAKDAQDVCAFFGLFPLFSSFSWNSHNMHIFFVQPSMKRTSSTSLKLWTQLVSRMTIFGFFTAFVSWRMLLYKVSYLPIPWHIWVIASKYGETMVRRLGGKGPLPFAVAKSIFCRMLGSLSPWRGNLEIFIEVGLIMLHNSIDQSDLPQISCPSTYCSIQQRFIFTEMQCFERYAHYAFLQLNEYGDKVS